MEILWYALAGAFGGFVRAIITGKGLILLPHIVVQDGQKYLNLGILAPLLIGAFAGWIAPAKLGIDSVVGALAGYTGADLIENLSERILKLPKRIPPAPPAPPPAPS